MKTKTAISFALFCSILVGLGFVGGVYTTLYALIYSDMQLKKAGDKVATILKFDGRNLT